MDYCQRLPGRGEEAGAALPMTVKNGALIPRSQARGCCGLNSWEAGSKPTGALSLLALCQPPSPSLFLCGNALPQAPEMFGCNT